MCDYPLLESVDVALTSPRAPALPPGLLVLSASAAPQQPWAAHGSSATAVRSPPPLPAPHVSFTLWMPVRFIPPDLNLASHQGYLSKSKFPLISSHKTWLLRTSQ